VQPPPKTLKNAKAHDIEAKNVILKAELAKVLHEKEAAFMHAKMAHLEIKEMAIKISSKKKKKDKLPTMAVPKVHWLTGQKGKDQWDTVKAQNKVKKQKKANADA